MAERRMISNQIIDSAPFLRAPVSSQALYFHLIAKADDDGIVEAFKVIRMTNTSEDDLRVLVAKGFVKILNDDLVSFIMDWHEHNRIRADRKKDSIYQNLLLKVLPNIELLTPVERADRKKNNDEDDNGTSHGQPKDGIGKDSIVEDSTGKEEKNIKKEKIDFSQFTNINIEVAKEWIAYKKLKDENAMLKVCKFLSQFSKLEQQQIVDNSIMNGYKGLFAPKKANSSGYKSLQEKNREVLQELEAQMRKQQEELIDAEVCDARG
jgi:hypothetical protein